VSEPHEPSYYEIALTNRQVVVAFVILLTCLLGAFFSGVWIGRESTARATQEAMVRATPPASQEGKSLEELDFFDSRGKKGKPGKHPEATSGGTLAEEMSGKKTTAPAPAAPAQEEPSPAAQASREAAAPAPTVLPDPAEERRNRRKARNAAAEEAAASAPAPAPAKAPAAPEPAPTPAKASKAAKNAAATPAIPKGSYVIQVFSSPDQTQAERIRGKLTSGGQKAYLSPIDRGGRTMYRVRIGPFKTRADAQGVADKVRKGYKLDTWVTE
jgi:DedD protein